MPESSPAVFLSYASQDAEAAARIAEALRSAGIEVWFDKSELVGGDAWDAKIRKQIQSCTLFVPIISANTQARAEGYFRLEWKLAVDRTHLMADDHPFLFPVVIDDTSDAQARVPDRFRERQWMRLKDTTPTAIADRIQALLAQDRIPAPAKEPVRKEAPPAKPKKFRGNPTTYIGMAIGLIFFAYFVLRPIWWSQIKSFEAEAIDTTASIPKIESLVVDNPSENPPNAIQPFPADPQLSQAYDLVNSLEANPEDFLLAEDIVKSVLADRPLDPEVVISMAWVQLAFVFRGFDRSLERIALARRYAERAERLAPDNPHALLAYGVYQLSVIRDIPLAEQTLRRAVALNPEDSMTQRFLDEACWRQTKYSSADILAMVEETAARFPDDALNHYAVARVYRNLGQPVEMEAALDRTLALYPLANAILYKARLAMVVRGDLNEMGLLLDQVPDRMRNTERVVVTRFQHALFSGDYDAGLSALERFTASWIEDNDYVGPTALMETILLESAGRSDVARRRAATAAQVMEDEAGMDLMRQTRRDSFIETWVYWHSGQKDTALESLRIALQATDRPYRPFPLNAPWDSLLAACLVMEQRETALELMREAIAPPNLVDGDHPWVMQSGDAYSVNMRDTLVNWLKLDPRMKPWRGDPDILELLRVDDLSPPP